MIKKLSFTKNSSEQYLLAFGIGFLALFLLLLPLMIMDRGYFIYYGDFVSQQLPFYQLANDAVRNGQLGWNWYTDLGGSFIGCYAFYLAGSPFFWLSAILPGNAVLYAIPWLLSLKHGFASVTAYAYIRRFVQNRNAALIGGLLYAFSGFQIFNLFFNHFQDVTAFFPLMLIAMEECVNNGKRGWFAASVALMAVINYFFFVGQVVFLILYFLIRCRCEDFHINAKRFAALCIEAVLGVGISAFLLIPAALAVILNNRVGEKLLGQDMLFYGDKTRIMRIVQSFFMIPDAPARPNLFSTNNGRWASIGGYLPMFSMAGVIAFMQGRKKHWASAILRICILCAMIPVLNSAFYLFNSSYYARWYYMPILIMAMVTARSLDDTEINWKQGMYVSTGMLALFGLLFFLPTRSKEGGVEFFSFANIPEYFVVVFAATAICCAGSWWVYLRRRNGKPYMRTAVILTTAACMISTGSVLYFGKCIGTDAKAYIDRAIRGDEKITISYENDDASYFRIDISEDYDNYPMFWGLSSMRAFQSTVTPSIMDFYKNIGLERDVASRVETSHYTLRGLFSVKYYFQDIMDTDDETEEPVTPNIPGFEYLRTENGFDIYENKYFIPMGFAYDSYVTEEMLAEKTKLTKEQVLIRALILNEEQAEKYSDCITKLPLKEALNINKEEYLAQCLEKQTASCENFEFDSRHFAGDITLEQPRLVFFSVPYESGWTASVNGSPVDTELVSGGFMAVRCEAGENHIEFRYRTPGFRTGLYLTIVSILLLALYIVFGKPLCRGRGMRHTHYYHYQPSDGIRAAQAYAESLRSHTTEKGENAE